MSVFNLLTEYDKEMIDAYIEDHVSWGKKDMDVVLNKWDEQKSRNLEVLFGEHDLILSRPYTYTEPLDNITTKIAREINKWHGKVHTVSEILLNIYRDNFNEKKDYSFLLDNSTYEQSWEIYYWFESLTSAEVLANNKINKSMILNINDKPVKFSEGMRPCKAILKLIKAFANDEYALANFEEFRIWHSQMLNQTTLDGQLSLSIHPLDFMTMSDNSSGWTSCMRWQDGPGDYCAGSLECMNSPYIVIAYLSSDKEKLKFHNPKHYSLPDYEWNSKKWRELFIVQDGIITEIKGYPYQDENLTNTCLMWLKDLAAKNLGWTYSDKEYSFGEVLPNDDKEVYVEADPTYFMYNDFGTLSKHRCRLNMENLMDRTKYRRSEYRNNRTDRYDVFIKVPYGGVATCMNCGAEIEMAEEFEGSLLCEKCDGDWWECPHCGRKYRGDSEAVYCDTYGESVCVDCYEQDCFTDDLDGCVYVYADFAINLYFADKEDIDEETGRVVFSYNMPYITTHKPNNTDDLYYDYFTEEPKPFKDAGYNCYYITEDMVKNTNVVYNLFGIRLKN